MSRIALCLAAGLAAVVATASTAIAANYPVPKPGDWIAHNFKFRDGEVLSAVKLHYVTIGNPSGEPVLILHGTFETSKSLLTPNFAGALFGPDQPFDARKYFIIIPDVLGSGGSTKPSDGLRIKFPRYDYTDMVNAEYQLVHDGLALIPEDRALFRGLTVDQHLRLTGRSGRPAREHVFTIFPALGAIRGRPARLLSGGEQQMLAIARALVTRPRVLLIDELSLGLAPPVVSELLSALRNLADSEGLAILLVEQQVDRALVIADRAHLMASGRLSESKDASALLLDRTAVENSYLGTLAASGPPPAADDADTEAKST